MSSSSTISSDNNLHQPIVPMMSFVIDLLAGGMSGAVTKTLAAPIERVKLLMQTQRSNHDLKIPYRHSWDCVLRVYKEQGIWSFWRGNVASVLRYFPSQAMNFAFKGQYQQLFLKTSGGGTPSFWVHFATNLVSGGLAGGTAMLASYPLDVVRTRMAADVRAHVQRSLRSCVVKMWRDGGIGEFYRGLPVALTGVVVFKALYMGGYDTAKLLTQGEKNSSVWSRLVMAQVITTGAGTLCYPFDTVKRRLMVQEQQLLLQTVTATAAVSLPSSSLVTTKYRNGLHCVRTIIREEGIRGLYAGLPANLVRGFSGSLLLVGYDEIRALLQPLVTAGPVH